jgi:NhaA family Na+:H+ antiporter
LKRPTRLTPEVDPDRDHILGGPKPDFTLVEYGSYASEYCHAAHEIVENLRERFGERLRFVYRHLPIEDRAIATQAAELAEYAAETENRFWDVHHALMQRDPHFDAKTLKTLAAELGIPPKDSWDKAVRKKARARVREQALSGLDSGARVIPTFFINGRRYDGAWDESALAEALTASPGRRVQTALIDFARWAPSTGILLLLATLIALFASNSSAGPAFTAFWQEPFGIRLGGREFALSVVEWVNYGLLTVFFVVVGLEIKREFTVGRLASRRAAILPIAGAFGGMTAPALIYLGVLGGGALTSGWGLTIATDTAFAIAILVLLGDRVPVDLRVFLTAAVIVDDLVAILVIALFYTGGIALSYLLAAAAIVVLLVLMNRWNVYSPLPYVVLGVLLWVCLHEAGLHATLAGVILAVVTPTRAPPNLRVLMAQAQLIIQADGGDASTSRPRLSESALRALDMIHERIESPASKLLRAMEPWSSYVVLPIFALANAGLVWTAGIFESHTRLVLAIVLGLVAGKPLGILAGAWLADRLKIAAKPEAYTWRQLAGAGALGGIGFTMSLFIAGEAFPNAADFTAAKVAIFLASLIAGVLGVVILLPKSPERVEG